MDTGSVSLTQYSYQTTLAASGQKSAVLQALASTYDAAAAAGSDDPLASAAGASTIGALVNGITALTGGEGASEASYAATYGGLSTSSATSLLASLGSGSDSSGDLLGFDSAVGSGASLAIAAYQAKTTYAGTATGTTSGTGTDAASLQAAKSAAATSTLNLLG